MSSPYLEVHLRECKFNTKRYNKLLNILNKMRKDNGNADRFLSAFANKCYGREPDRTKAKKEARRFLESVFGPLNEVYSLGPDKAIEGHLKKLYEKIDDQKEDLIKPVRLDETNAKARDGSHAWEFKLERFLIGKTLGVGGTAEVKLAYDTKLKKQVAFKILQPKYAKSAEKEIGVLKALKHPNIIRVHEHFDNILWKGKKTSAFAIELANGGECIEYMMYTGKFEPELARWFIAQLVEGVDYCHSQNIVHRDLKHDNCLLDDDFKLKITDFGFAKFYYKDNREQMNTAIGTAQYAAPEILSRKAYNEKVDMFSIGVMLFITLSGSQPWRRAEADRDKWYNMFRQEDTTKFWNYHKRKHEFSKDAKELLEGLLAHKPKNRWTMKQVKQSNWLNGKKLSDKKAADRLKKRKKDVDKKKFADASREERTKKEIVDSGQLHTKIKLPVCDLLRIPLTSFKTKDDPKFVMELIKDAVNKLRGSYVDPATVPVFEDEEQNVECYIELKFLPLKDALPAIVKADVAIYRVAGTENDEEPTSIVVFTPRRDFDSRLYLPQTFNKLMSYIAYLRTDVVPASNKEKGKGKKRDSSPRTSSSPRQPRTELEKVNDAQKRKELHEQYGFKPVEEENKKSVSGAICGGF